MEGAVKLIVGVEIPLAVRNLPTTRAGDTERATRHLESQRAVLADMPLSSYAKARHFGFIPYMAVEVNEAGLRRLVDDPRVTHIKEDIPMAPSLAQSVPLVGADRAWSRGYSGLGQAVAVVDTGVQTDHPMLAGKVTSQACFSNS